MRVSAFHLWSGLSPASKRLVAAGAGMLLTMVAAVSITMWDLRVVALTTARSNVGKLGIAIAEQTARSIQGVDLVLQDLQQTIQHQGIATPAQFSTELSTLAIQATLRRRGEAIPQANAFTIVGADGRLVNFSRRWPIPSLDLTDRDYYRYFRDHDDMTPVVSRPVYSRADGAWTVYVARRVDGPNGLFLGIVLCAIDLDYFRDFYRALTAGTDTSVMLLKRDGTNLTGFPVSNKVGEVLPPASLWHRVVAQGGPAIFTTYGFFINGMRIISVHPLADYPLVVDVAVSQKAALANWRRATILVAIGTASAVLCVLLLLRALVLQLQRLESSKTSLAEQNVSLLIVRRSLEDQAQALRDSQAHLAATSDALKTTLENIDQGIVMVGADHRVVVSNQRATQMLGLPEDMLSSDALFDDIVAHQRAAGEFRGSAWQDEEFSVDLTEPLLYQRQRPDGRVLEVRSAPLVGGGMVRTYTDITDRRASEARIRYAAHHDDLTKLVNRVVFRDRLKDAIDLVDRIGRGGVAILYLDLDRFKLINDSRGHDTGDKLLLLVADRLRAATRVTDTVARTGGDEFAIVHPFDDDLGQSQRLANRLLHAMRQPFEIDGRQCRIGLSIGIAHYPDHAADADTLLRNADVALYRAKTEGRGLACLYDESMDLRQKMLFDLEEDLRLALDLGQFDVEYQPILDVATRRIAGCEALLRWRHPTRGTIPPGDFIQLAERSGLMTPIGLWVLETACAEAAQWPADMRIAVNLSPVQFNHESLTSELTSILRRTGLMPSRLVLEVTEGLLLEDTSRVLCIMHAVRALGVRFGLDDFGTGYAGLGYLRQFPFQVIKIDKLFIQGMVEEPEMRAIVATLLELSAALSLSVIAEGVETAAQLTALTALRCPYVQGYFIGHPASAQETRQAIRADRAPVEG